ncbi:hypothetical protein EDD70_0910 [Hydrogenoanaerobacterium saccharovorans]|uniref:Uncharacterized protein n=1 Tax=Hydrogenoanaerobacterium saccharovorans TaxID=474960 RepID=A0A1H8A831_9FIRM|nr:hypothetical protein [Hydrogenoanaerobacterium saccharovorans]RPF48098.1 hypothetical protein EDD70_0910 [Hydrogenoanaerobacterium saccharovorans]SEM66840.1 hypothetical protein SAMN05216180_1181 [Hydrogenoanaerobacterium saccharovorans]
MHQATKPNVTLPFSLHDAKVTSMICNSATAGNIDGTVSFIFDNGYCKIEGNSAEQTGKASVTISGIDFDFSHVYYCNKNKRQEVTFPQLASDIDKNGLEIVQEAYGYNFTKWSGFMFKEKNIYEIEIEIYHFNETLYKWSDRLK